VEKGGQIMFKKIIYFSFALLIISAFSFAEVSFADYSLTYGSVQYRKYENTDTSVPDDFYRVHFTIEKDGTTLIPQEYADIEYVLVFSMTVNL
jgi:hypothetical protein